MEMGHSGSQTTTECHLDFKAHTIIQGKIMIISRLLYYAHNHCMETLQGTHVYTFRLNTSTIVTKDLDVL